MIEIIPSEEQIKSAEKKAKDLGAIRLSIRNGEGNIYGFLGEILVADYFNCKIENTYQYDLISPKGKRIDVKTKVTTVIPQLTFECSLVAYIKQDTDYYVFVRILADKSKAWILGYIKPKEYFERAVYRVKGDLDPNSTQGKPFYFTANCHNLPISMLTQIEA